MRCCFTHFVLLSVLFCVSAAHAGTGSQDTTAAKKCGYVYYSGRELKPPFKFTGHGTDTLYLNDIPYAPVRRRKKTFGPPVVVTKLTRQQHALGVLAHERSKAGKMYEERLAMYAEIYRQSSLVDSVKIGSDFSVKVYWKDMREYPNNFEICELPREEPPSDSMLAELRLKRLKSHEESFWRTYNKGGIVTFGEYGHIFSPAGQTARNRELINRLARGDSLTAEDVWGSILHYKTFYRLMIEHLRAAKGE